MMYLLAYTLSFSITVLKTQATPLPIYSLIDDDPTEEGPKNPNLNQPYPPRSSNGISERASFFIGFGVTTILTIIIGLCLIFIYRTRIRLSEDELAREEENQAYMELNLEEQELFFQSKDYLINNPYLRDELTFSQNLSIQEKGIKAWEFIKDSVLTNNDVMILNKTEINFFKKFECSVTTNLPIPMQNDVYYFESKIYSLPDDTNTLISIGLGIKPYPWFRLPGRHHHSISYDSNGYRRFNQPFKFETDPPFPKLIEGDVIGVGYRVRSGTVFFTRNGKKVSELKLGGHIKNFKIPNHGQIYPIIGANNLCSIHVNLGQMGYVFIEGNVKKWGFAPLEGNGPAPPAYNKFNFDILLERLEIDDENNDLLEREDDFPPNFWEIHPLDSNNDEYDDDNDSSGVLAHDKFSYNAYSEVNSNDERITLNSLLPPNKPPSYNSEDEDEPHLGPSEEAQESSSHSNDSNSTDSTIQF